MTQTQNNQKKNNRFTLSSFIPIIVLLIIMAYMLLTFSRNILNQSAIQVSDVYMEEVERIEDKYAKEVYAIEYLSIFYAKFVCEQNDIFNYEAVNHLKNITELENVFNVYLVKTDLSAIDADGQKVDNIVSVPGYEDAILSNGREHKFVTNMYGERVMLIVTALDMGTENKGHIIVEYLPSVNEVIDNNSKSQVKGTYIFVDSEGNVIESKGENILYSEPSTNVIETLSSAEFKKSSYQAFKNAILQQKEGMAEFSDSGLEKSIFYKPVEKCNASVIMFVNTSSVRNSEKAATTEMRRLLHTMVFIVIAIILFMIGFIIYSRLKFNMESDDLKNKADTDQLTQLYNKMATESKIQEYIENEGKDSVSMFFILDVDDFKKINDTMGHAFGDKVLVSLGHQIRSWFRMNDIIGRIGGDEFIIFVKDVKNEEIIRKEGNRILQFFKGFTVGEYTRYAPTASIGCSIYPTDGKDFQSLYKSADKALYKSKRNGKNQLTFYGDVDKKEAESIQAREI